jgi:hypothetical protein
MVVVATGDPRAVEALTPDADYHRSKETRELTRDHAAVVPTHTIPKPRLFGHDAGAGVDDDVRGHIWSRGQPVGIVRYECSRAERTGAPDHDALLMHVSAARWERSSESPDIPG